MGFFAELEGPACFPPRDHLAGRLLEAAPELFRLLSNPLRNLCQHRINLVSDLLDRIFDLVGDSAQPK